MDEVRHRRIWSAGIACVVLALFITLARVHAGSSSRAARLRGHLSAIARKGESSLYVSGRAFHLDRSYPRELRQLLNEDAWGGGFGRTLKLADGGAASLAFTAFEDSLGEVQYNLGYIREWRSKPLAGHLTLGAGLSAFLTSRADFFQGTPFPAFVPLVSAEVGHVALLATFVPRLPNRGEPSGVPEIYGDVFYVFSRIRLP